ncbi:MAG: nicotinate-nucleotide--dimethylbenzimidazole phosphoribosyltransferase [Deltaproteobacteria bacterium]|nr:nicotinate-nucleotide--dimethylbenzimidazole phosphoribosyltransferase [Deltaproteobacteria bacterium]
MTLIDTTIRRIHPIPLALDDAIKRHINDLTKPVGSLGQLEEAGFRYARIRQQVIPDMPVKRLYTFAADHGVVEEGVSAFPGEVTKQMVSNMVNGGAAINVFGRHVGCDVRIVDIGVNGDLSEIGGLIHRKIRHGTGNMVSGPAMHPDEMLAALQVGVELADEAAQDGVTLMGTGEMGIGNTTASAALMHVLLPCALDGIIGRGTGIDDAGLQRKRTAIAAAVKRHGLTTNKGDEDPLKTLSTVGGLEIAGLAGLILGSAAHRIAILIDGFISSAAALVACRLCPSIADYLFFSHLSAERGHRTFLKEMGAKPLLDLGFRLGEGTGAALSMSLIDAAVKMMREMATFSSAGVSGEVNSVDEGAA